MGEIAMVLIGVYATLVGFKVVSASKKQGAEYEAWHAKWGSKLKIIGPLLVICGIALFFVKASR